jgi:hypothetical protein
VCPTKRTEPDGNAISECLRTDHRIIEGMKKAFEDGNFDVKKVG